MTAMNDYDNPIVEKAVRAAWRDFISHMRSAYPPEEYLNSRLTNICDIHAGRARTGFTLGQYAEGGREVALELAFSAYMAENAQDRKSRHMSEARLLIRDIVSGEAPCPAQSHGDLFTDACMNAIIIAKWAFFARYALRYRLPEKLLHPERHAMSEVE
jgi:hypothetical protein